MRWSKRIGVGTALAAGAMALSATAGAALVSTSTSDGSTVESAAVDVGGIVKVSDAKAHSGADGQSATWSPVVVAGMSPLDHSPSGWSGPAAPVGNVADQLTAITCPPGGIAVPVQNTQVCAFGPNSFTYTDSEEAYAFGEFGQVIVGSDSGSALITVMESHAAAGECEGGMGFTAPVVVVTNPQNPQWTFPLGNATSGCFVLP